MARDKNPGHVFFLLCERSLQTLVSVLFAFAIAALSGCEKPQPWKIGGAESKRLTLVDATEPVRVNICLTRVQTGTFGTARVIVEHDGERAFNLKFGTCQDYTAKKIELMFAVSSAFKQASGTYFITQ